MSSYSMHHQTSNTAVAKNPRTGAATTDSVYDFHNTTCPLPSMIVEDDSCLSSFRVVTKEDYQFLLLGKGQGRHQENKYKNAALVQPKHQEEEELKQFQPFFPHHGGFGQSHRMDYTMEEVQRQETACSFEPLPYYFHNNNNSWIQPNFERCAYSNGIKEQQESLGQGGLTDEPYTPTRASSFCSEHSTSSFTASTSSSSPSLSPSSSQVNHTNRQTIHEDYQERHQHDDRLLLPPEFSPQPWSVIIGRDKISIKAPGTRRLHIIIGWYLERYSKSYKDKQEKSNIISEIESTIREAYYNSILSNTASLPSGCGIVTDDNKNNHTSKEKNIVENVGASAPVAWKRRGAFITKHADGNWYEAESFMVREKIARILRESLHTRYSSSSRQKRARYGMKKQAKKRNK